MARHKVIDTHPRLLPVALAAQLLPGIFYDAVDHRLDHAIDHAIARLCEERETFIALCGTRTPHVTTIATFVSTLGADIAHVFAAVLAVCDQQGLIGRAMFAIDGVKPSSNASEQRRGERADFERQTEKLVAAAARRWMGSGSSSAFSTTSSRWPTQGTPPNGTASRSPPRGEHRAVRVRATHRSSHPADRCPAHRGSGGLPTSWLNCRRASTAAWRGHYPGALVSTLP